MADLEEIIDEAGIKDRAVVIFECSPELKERCRAEALRRDRTLSSFIRTVLEAELGRSKK